jgi:hypothetical protein
MTRRRWLRTVCTLTTFALVCLQPSQALAYLKFGYEVNGKQYTLKWTTTPVRYFVTDAGVPGVTSSQFQSAVASAFQTWESVPTASITYQFGGFTRSLPGEDDGRSTLGFLNEPELDRVLASTSYLVDGESGELLEADIFFNSAFQWSVAPAGERGRWDLQSIALHEIGHLSGLGHSAIGETEIASGGARRVLSTGAVMFPIALGSGDISGRSLQPDDIAGISDLYPDDGFNDKTGSVSGRITKNGQGVFGAHVVAFDPKTGQMVGNFSLNTDGEFSIAGLQPGPHVLRVEPIDDADTDSFFESTEPTDLNFRTAYHDRLIIVPRGGDSGTVAIAVVPK